MLRIDNAVLYFNRGKIDEKRALDNVSLSLEKGDFLTIIGGNGAGKSTLLSAIAGNIYLDEGYISLDSKDITFEKEHRRANFIGRLFQNPLMGTAPNMTIEENLALAYGRGRIAGLSFAIKKNMRSEFAYKLAQLELGLENRLKDKVGLLSGGQRQALTLLMATIKTPKLLLLDEHTAALDPQTATKIMETTKRVVKERKITTIMITHNLDHAISAGNRLIMMNNGKILSSLTGAEKQNSNKLDLISLYSKDDALAICPL